MYDELINRLHRYTENCVAYKLDADFASAVQEAADVVERKRGEWIRVTEELGESWMCSECMEEFIPHDGMEEFASYAHFCPNCGADMRGAPNGV